ncbi:MAG TPA: DoxX family protein [Fibrobacteria bacterium]|nr:DoxX family protein [Fibrobacteria bacterium]HOX51976.1 DoxX family protein [Fibrobacteria bacterium]
MNESIKPSVLRFLPAIGRWFLGLPMVVFGALDLFHPMAPPPDLAPAARAFSEALARTGYMMPMIGVVLLSGGLLLLANRFVPLALLLLAPFFVNSLLFHAVLERSGLVPSVIFASLLLSLAWAYRGVFAHVLRARNATGA